MLVNIAKVIHDEDKAIEWLIDKGLPKLLRYHGVSQKIFPYYLKELEFRCNNIDNIL